MAITPPGEIIWILEKIGIDWPPIDEDELRRAAKIIREFRNELEDRFQAVDNKVNGDISLAMKGKAGPAFVAAWNTNRSQNLQRLLDLLEPVPGGIEVAAVIVTGLKGKAIFEMTTTLMAFLAMMSNPITAPGGGLLLIAKKKLLDIAFDVALEQALNEVLPVVLEPLVEKVPDVIAAVMDSPVVEVVGGDPDEFYAAMGALEQAEGDMEIHATDIDTLLNNLMADLSGLNIMAV